MTSESVGYVCICHGLMDVNPPRTLVTRKEGHICIFLILKLFTLSVRPTNSHQLALAKRSFLQHSHSWSLRTSAKPIWRSKEHILLQFLVFIFAQQGWSPLPSEVISLSAPLVHIFQLCLCVIIFAIAKRAMTRQNVFTKLIFKLIPHFAPLFITWASHSNVWSITWKRNLLGQKWQTTPPLAVKMGK